MNGPKIGRCPFGRASWILATGMMGIGMAAYADTPLSMAPPVNPGAPRVLTLSGNASEDTVFAWNEVPAREQIPITRAVFDQGGYQLYDTEGETIVVPFTGNNLYVMKFAESTSGDMYFVNEGDYPVLYVPRDGYLENATVSGARWYPFTQQFHPVQPVYLGVAPSWSYFTTMGWYPDMWCRGGYWSSISFVRGAVFAPTSGFVIIIGDNRFRGWGPYHDWTTYHPAPNRVGWYNPGLYVWATRPHRPVRNFWGGRPGRDRRNRVRPSRPISPTNRWDSMRAHRNYDQRRREPTPRAKRNQPQQPSGRQRVRPSQGRVYTPQRPVAPTNRVWRHEQTARPPRIRPARPGSRPMGAPPPIGQPPNVRHEQRSTGPTGVNAPPRMPRPTPPAVVPQRPSGGFQRPAPSNPSPPSGGNVYRPPASGGGRWSH